jgi:hypothetical protein
MGVGKSNSEKEVVLHLEKPEKLIPKLEIDNKLMNRSIWKIIFKKS